MKRAAEMRRADLELPRRLLRMEWCSNDDDEHWKAKKEASRAGGGRVGRGVPAAAEASV
jgi:hypothetical protein